MPVLNNTKVPKELESEVCKDYLSKKYDLKDLASKYKCSSANIVNICKRNNSYTIKPKTQKQLDRMSKCNENYFEDITTPEQAYLLGVIISDGHVGKNKTLVLRLNAKDIELLEKLNKYLESNFKIQVTDEFDKRTNKTYNLCMLMIYRDKLADDLLKLGIGNNKSVEVKLPKIKPNLIRDVIRGMVDGDGGWHVGENNRIAFRLTSATIEILQEIQVILMKECELPETRILFDTGCYKLGYTSNEHVRKIFNYLYDDVKEGLYLSRKYNYVKTHFYNLENGIKTRNYGDEPVSQNQTNDDKKLLLMHEPVVQNKRGPKPKLKIPEKPRLNPIKEFLKQQAELRKLQNETPTSDL